MSNSLIFSLFYMPNQLNWRKDSLSKASKSLWAAWIIILIVVAGGSFYLGRYTAPQTQKLESITFILNWAISGEQAGIVVAVDKGFYADEGLAVTILRGFGSTDTSKRVFAGEGEFGFVDTIAMIKARAEGIALKQIGMGYHFSPVGLFGLPDVGPTTPDEIRGKKIGCTSGSTDTIQFEIICALNNIDVDTEVNRVWLSSTAKVPAVLSDEVDGVSGYDTGEGAQIAFGADIDWEDVTKLMYRDWGVDTYGNGLVAKESYIDDNPDVVERFVRATMKGWGYALQNPEEAVDIVVKMFPELEEDSVALEWEITTEHIWNEETQDTGIGYMVKEKMQKSIDITVQVFGIDPIPVDDVYTNEFVEDLPDDIKFPLA